MAKQLQLATRHTELDVYAKSFAAAKQAFEITKSFPIEERSSLTDQIRRSSRSVCANLAEAWRKRRYRAAFGCKLNDCEAEAAETQTWLQFAVECRYVDRAVARDLYREYDGIIAMLVQMIASASKWIIKEPKP